MSSQLILEITWVLQAQDKLIESFEQAQLVVRAEEVQVLVIFDEDLHEPLDETGIIMANEPVDLCNPQLLDEESELCSIYLLLLLTDVLI